MEQGALQNEDINCDDDAGKDSLCISDSIADQEALLELEEQHVSTLNSATMLKTVVPSALSLETSMDRGKDNAKYSLSSSYCDNKSAYSTLCPTGRISFKLYDWNPAEFPRRLRHQIFEWLASMPVELEGYIRPGCTILTVFIAMPKNMWVKLFEDPVAYVHDFIVKPGKMLSGRGSVTVYLNHMIFRVIEGGTSVMKVNVKMQAPKLHYVYPMCFEAGKPIEFVACGSNLLQPKLRFLVSFAGKYMVHSYSVASLHGEAESNSSSFDHQLYKIRIHQTEPNLFGPAFIEVENESGLSNFIPVLIGDEETCCEIRSIQQKFGTSLFPKGQQFGAKNLLPNSCETFIVRQKAFSELLLDIAWLLKEPASESSQQTIASCQIQRLNCLLSFLIHTKSVTILEKVFQNIKILIGNMELDSKDDNGSNDDARLLQQYMNSAREVLNEKDKRSADSVLRPEYDMAETNYGSQSSSQDDIRSTIPATDQDLATRGDYKLGMMVVSTTAERSETDPLLNREVVMDVDVVKEWPRKSCGHVFSGTVLRSRPTILLISVVAVCFGVCAILFHPHKVGEFAVSIRRCLFDKF
ncbi:squamosa promoter-binding-like protein 7 [Carica papaya]|uniref:squamosa promoter-binding-like protein 7 n=1 Tax=Carica papaya TaxID=3649 RepID=UPI000B8CDCDA|nr:squamosa promoter-binding-like protein 7 [Carica papaya]